MAAGTTMASAVKPNLHNALARDVHEFDIPPISLNGRTDEVDDALNLLFNGRFAGRFGHRGGHRFELGIIDREGGGSNLMEMGAWCLRKSKAQSKL